MSGLPVCIQQNERQGKGTVKVSYGCVQEVMYGKVLEQCMRVPYTRLPQLLGWSRASNRRLSQPGGHIIHYLAR